MLFHLSLESERFARADVAVIISASIAIIGISVAAHKCA